MAINQDVDELGRVLPASDWPADRPAPGALELVRRFCNTTNLESGADRLASTRGAVTWMRGQGRAIRGASDVECIALRDLREAVRSVARAHQQNRSDAAGAARLVELVDDLSFRIDSADGCFRFTLAAGDPITELRRDVVLAIVDADTSGTWPRLKTCVNCQWVLYDASKNRSGRWCSMRACGGRDKVRNYRARSRTDG